MRNRTSEQCHQRYFYFSTALPNDFGYYFTVAQIIYGLADDLSFDEGTTAQLMCQAKGWPYVTYVWVKSDPNLGDTIVGHQKIITFANLAKTNAGRYTCLARNIVGNDSFTLNLDVHSEY